MVSTHKGSCFCGAVTIEVTGAPEEMGYCHCSSCRSYAGAPVSAFTLWNKGDVTVTRGEGNLGAINKTGMSNRRFCSECGGHVFVEHPGLGLTDVHASTLPPLSSAPSVHLTYAEQVLPMPDGLPKLRDFPAEIGGSGERLSE